MNTPKRIITPFDSDYVSQIDHGRQLPFRIPELKELPRFFRDNISDGKTTKNFRLSKSNI